MIESFFIPIQTDGGVCIALDTIFKKQHIITSLGIGEVRYNEAFLTPPGQQTLEAFTAYTAANKSQTIFFWELADAERTTNRLIKGLNAALADQKSAVFFVCNNDFIYDALYTALRVNYRDYSIQ